MGSIIKDDFKVEEVEYLYKQKCHIEIPLSLKIAKNSIENGKVWVNQSSRGNIISLALCPLVYDGDYKSGALYLLSKKGELYIGWSCCSDKDKFDKDKALEIAISRAVKYSPKALADIKKTFPHREYDEDCVLDFYQQAVTRYVKHSSN